MVGHLRRVSAERAGDTELARLIGELTMASVEFARLWSLHDVHAGVGDRKTFRHAQAGTFELAPEVLILPRDQQTLCVYRAEQGSADAQAPALLNTLVASGLAPSGPTAPAEAGTPPSPARRSPGGHGPGASDEPAACEANPDPHQRGPGRHR